jgi:hypothetical protein
LETPKSCSRSESNLLSISQASGRTLRIILSCWLIMRQTTLDRSAFSLPIPPICRLAEHNTPNTSVLANSTLLAEVLEEWKSSKTGPLSNIPTNNLVWGRLPGNSSFDDPSPGPNSPHWELILALNLGPMPEPHVITAISIVSPASRK